MSAQFIPHGHCYLWKTNLVGLNLISDLLIALSYYSIPITLIYFVRKRKDLPFPSIFLLFGAFIISCGTSHLMEIWTLWHPIYWISGTVKAITALISLYTAIEMFSVVPLAINLPNPEQLQLANNKLEAEIAERKQTEVQLEKEQVFIKAMLDNLSDGIVACDENGILTLFNQASQKIFGMPQEPIPPEQWSEYYSLYYPDGQTHLKQDDIPLFRAFSGESFTNSELMAVLKQGKARTLLANGSPIVDTKGVKIGAVVAVRDISDRQQAEKALQESESTLRSFYDSAPMMMGIVESLEREDLRHISGNNTTVAFFGLTPETMPGKRASELAISPENRQRLIAAYLQSETTLEPVNFEFTEKINQDTKHFSITVSTISQKSPEGHSRFSYIMEDISDRKQMERVLQDREERFRLAFEDAAIGMALIATDGYFLKANRSLCEIVGYSETELTTITYRDIAHPDEQIDLNLEYLRRLLGGTIHSCQFQKRCIHKLGHTVWVLLSVSLVRDIQDKPQYFVAQIQDITDRKAAETRITKSLQEKEVLLQEIHHRVKNNLQVICSLLNLQSRYLKEEKIIKSFKETQNRVKSMALVHEQLYQSDNLSQIILLDYVKQLTNNLFRAYSITSYIECYTEIDEFYLDLDLAVPCGLIINEIVSNAIKYAFCLTDKGKILIKAFANQAKNLVLIIEDNGQGLKPDFNLENSKSLGLKLVKNLTNQLQGEFKIYSDCNSGTRFEFTFNRIKQQVK